MTYRLETTAKRIAMGAGRGADLRPLADERLPSDALGPVELDDVRIARTASRSVLGFMNDSAQRCRYTIERAGGLEHIDVRELKRFLRRQLHNRDGYRRSLDLVFDRLAS